MNTNNPPVRELFGFERDPFVPDPATIWLDDERGMPSSCSKDSSIEAGSQC